MGKKLVTLGQISHLVNMTDKVLEIEKGMIVTQGALDYAREHQIRIVYKSDEQAHVVDNKLEHQAKSKTDLKASVCKLLKDEYGIEDEKVLTIILEKLNQK